VTPLLCFFLQPSTPLYTNLTQLIQTTMDNPPPPARPQPPQLLYGIVWKKVTYRQQGSLETVFPYFTQELQYELQSLYAMDDNTTTTIVNRWITNLNVIESGLNSCFKQKHRSKESELTLAATPGSASSKKPHHCAGTRRILRASGADYSSSTGPAFKDTIPTSTTPNPPSSSTSTLPHILHQSTSDLDSSSALTPDSATKIQSFNQSTTFTCLRHDEDQCQITGRSTQEFAIEVAHIIPYSLGNSQGCRQFDFWKILEVFYGQPVTNQRFNNLSKNINNLGHLIALDNSIHTMFNKGTISLTPHTLD